jgi:hypothetical protein
MSMELVNVEWISWHGRFRVTGFWREAGMRYKEAYNIETQTRTKYIEEQANGMCIVSKCTGRETKL